MSTQLKVDLSMATPRPWTRESLQAALADDSVQVGLVQQVNSFDAMREALAIIADVWDCGGDFVDEHEAVVRAALKLAEGTQFPCA